MDFLIAKDDLHRCRFEDRSPAELGLGQARLLLSTFGLTSNNIASAHRAALPPAYNGYTRVDGDPIYDAEQEDQQQLLRPLFFTSYLIDDFLEDSGFFGASTIVLSSASSKTASGLAFLLSRREGIEVVGLTSSRSAQFAREIGVYDHIVTYEELDSLPDGRAVYVDMAGNAELRSAVHEHYTGVFFFAPDRVTKRSADWGRDGLELKLAEAWHPYVKWTAGWLQVIHGSGTDAVESAYLDLLDGRIDPAKAHVLSL